MKKNVIYTVMVNGVELSELENIQDDLEAVFKEYVEKRISVQLTDDRLVSPRTGSG